MRGFGECGRLGYIHRGYLRNMFGVLVRREWINHILVFCH